MLEGADEDAMLLEAGADALLEDTTVDETCEDDAAEDDCAEEEVTADEDVVVEYDDERVDDDAVDDELTKLVVTAEGNEVEQAHTAGAAFGGEPL